MPYLGRALNEDIFHYKKYWTKSAMKRRKENNEVYKKSEVGQVYDDVEIILDRFIERLDTASSSIKYAKGNLQGGVEAIANLAVADDNIKKVNLTPVIDTIQGIVENEAENE